jgi:membrane protease YdiL (CAAX protease family)
MGEPPIENPEDASSDAQAPAAEAGLLAEAVQAVSTPERSDASLWVETGLVLVAVLVPWYWSAVSGLLWPHLYIAGPPALDDATGLFWHAQAIAILLLVLWRSGEPWKRFGFRRPAPIGDAATAALVFLGAYVTQFVAAVFVFVFAPQEGAATSSGLGAAASPSSLLGWLFKGFVICLGAFSEELALRGYFLPRLERLLGSSWKAVALSAVLFAGCHVYQGTAGLAGSFAFGLFYGTAFCLNRRLWPLVLAHAAHNLLLVIR